ncbi:MAG: hypothetical protein MJY47_00655 [Fibrobacter sp.]|nr:hypothetical protein [Fibrobacter sp.]
MWLILAAAVFGFEGENTDIHDNSHISIFLQPAVSFLSFDQREYFQDAIDTIYEEFRSQALDEEETLSVAKQDFQKVNFCFPITGGLQFQIFQDNFISAGVSFIYDHESVVLTDRKNKSHNYDYTIQGIPFFLEYRFAIPTNLMSLSGESLFSISLRWYWALPGTEIYTTWGKLAAETPWYGSGFGLSVGYLLFSWKNLNVFGDIGFSTISVKSKKTYESIVPDGPNEKAKWDVGGIQLQIRVSFGVWNKPKPVDEDSLTADTTLVSSTTDSTKVSAVSDSTMAKPIADTVKTVTDSATTVTDSSATTPANDSTQTKPVADTTASIADTAVAPVDSVKTTEASTTTNAEPSTSTAANTDAAPKAPERPQATVRKDPPKEPRKESVP